MVYTFTIPGRLPGQNEVVQANRTNFYLGNKMKKDAEKLVRTSIREKLHGLHIGCSVVLVYRFYEPNRRRDVDNISGGATKIIQDALVDEGVIINDGQRYVLRFDPYFYCDPENPRIEVEIHTIEGGALFGK